LLTFFYETREDIPVVQATAQMTHSEIQQRKFSRVTFGDLT